MTPEERFWSKVDKSGECWLWTASVNNHGYGQFRLRGTMALPHRLSYEWEYGPIRLGLMVDHKCHTPTCVRPSHLQAVTRKENQENRSGPTRRSTSGVLGVSWDKRRGKWHAKVNHHKRNLHVGYFDSLDEASSAVVQKRNTLYTNNLKDRE